MSRQTSLLAKQFVQAAFDYKRSRFWESVPTNGSFTVRVPMEEHPMVVCAMHANHGEGGLAMARGKDAFRLATARAAGRIEHDEFTEAGDHMIVSFAKPPFSAVCVVLNVWIELRVKLVTKQHSASSSIGARFSNRGRSVPLPSLPMVLAQKASLGGAPPPSSSSS